MQTLNLTTPETICSLVKKECQLQDLPLDLAFSDAGLSHAQLIRIQIRINKTYARTVSKVLFIDNCYTLTDRFNEKK